MGSALGWERQDEGGCSNEDVGRCSRVELGECCGNRSGANEEAARLAARGKHLEERLQFLSRVRLFRRLPEGEHPGLARAMVPTSFGPGKVIISQGERGHAFYVIRSGECSVAVGGAVVATLRSGDYFGETALLRDEPRNATITAVTEVDAFTVGRAKFEKLGLHAKLEFPRRGAVAGGAGALATRPPAAKTPAEEGLMAAALRSNANLATMAALDDKKIQQMIGLMWREAVSQGAEVVKQGDLSADYFYIVTEGTFEVTVARDGQGQSGDTVTPECVGVLQPGQSFGELALMYFAPRAATVAAKTDAAVMVLDRVQFKTILASASVEASRQHAKHLDKVELLAPLREEERWELAKALIEMKFSQNEDIFEQGEEGDFFYILIEGSVSVVKDGKEVAKLKATASEAQFFGERALLECEPRAATVTVTSAAATALVVDKVSFDMLLGPLGELAKRGKTGTGAVQKAGPDAGPLGEGSRFGKILRKDLTRLGLLGCGGFGMVSLVEHKGTGDTYALKELSKGYVVKCGMQRSVVSEKNVQLLCDSPFIIKLYETYNGAQNLMMLLELALGGELYATYNRKNLWGDVDCARFYVAGTTLAFEHMHSKKIIFRDLKPENLLLTDTGFVKLTDMGLAKVVVGKTYTTCGTPDYFAPELVASQGHTHALDWWTLGILTFELLAGHPPFEAATPMQTYEKVNKGINRVRFPRECRASAGLLIKGLCASVPSERLPMKRGGADNVKEHEWFQGFDWQAMADLTAKPPFVPVVKGRTDAANFSASAEDKPPLLEYVDDHSGWDAGFATSR